MKVSRRQVKVGRRQHKSHHALHNAVHLQWLLDGVGSGWMNILGVFNMLGHNFVINKPMLEFATSVRFRCLQTSIFLHQLQGSTIRRS